MPVFGSVSSHGTNLNEPNMKEAPECLETDASHFIDSLSGISTGLTDGRANSGVLLLLKQMAKSIYLRAQRFRQSDVTLSIGQLHGSVQGVQRVGMAARAHIGSP